MTVRKPLLLRYAIEALLDWQSANSCDSDRPYADQAPRLVLCSSASVPEQAETLHPTPRYLVLYDPRLLGQALSGATALTWQLGRASMDLMYYNSVRDRHTALRSAGPADGSDLQ